MHFTTACFVLLVASVCVFKPHENFINFVPPFGAYFVCYAMRMLPYIKIFCPLEKDFKKSVNAVSKTPHGGVFIVHPLINLIPVLKGYNFHVVIENRLVFENVQ